MSHSAEQSAASACASDSSTSASAWVFTSPSVPLELHTGLRLDAPLQPGEVLLRLDAACICGSDMHTISGKRSDPAAPLVLGHEGLGTVVASANPQAPAGTVLTWGLAAPQCTLGGGAACQACSVYQMPQKCARVLKYGHAPWPRPAAPLPREHLEGLSGCFATHALLRAGTVLVPVGAALAAGVPASALASVNCAGGTAMACWRAAQRHLAASTRGTAAAAAAAAAPAAPVSILILGAGLLGLYTAAAAARDCPPGSTICCVDVSPSRLQLARSFGATHTALAPPPSEPDSHGALTAAIASALPSAAFDAAIEVCGQPSVVPPALALLRPGGVLVLAGMVHPASSLAGVTGEAIIRKCAAVVGVHNYEGGDLQEAVALLLHLHTAVLPAGEWGRLFSPPCALSQLPSALALAAGGEWARVVLAPSSSEQ